MKVEKILTQKGADVYSIQSNKYISDAVTIMNEKHIGALIVLDENQNIQGIVSERDILKSIAKNGFQDMRIKDIMTPKDKLIVGSKDNDLEYLMSMMTENNIRHIPIMDKEKLVALVSIRDLIKVLLKDAVYEKQLLTDYMSGTDLD